MAKTTSRCGTAWLLAAFVLLVLLVAGCTCARQDDGSDTTATSPEREATSPPPLVNPADDLPDVVDNGDGAAVSAAAGQAEDGAEAVDDGEDDAAEDPAEEDESTDDTAEDEGVDEDETEDDSGDEGNGDEDVPADNGNNEDAVNSEDETVAPNPDIDAAAIYQAAMCAGCHGGELKGTQRGPSLKDLEKYWDAAKLAQFLKSPAYYSVDNQRLIELSHQYNIAMPPLHRNNEEIYAVAYWLLNQ